MMCQTSHGLRIVVKSPCSRLRLRHVGLLRVLVCMLVLLVMVMVVLLVMSMAVGVLPPAAAGALLRLVGRWAHIRPLQTQTYTMSRNEGSLRQEQWAAR